MGSCLIGDQYWMAALKAEAFHWMLEVPERHKTQEEYTRALEYALAAGWSGPMRNHAGRWFTMRGERELMCQITSLGDNSRHRCKDMVMSKKDLAAIAFVQSKPRQKRRKAGKRTRE